MEKTDKIFLAGHQGLVGSNILKQLQNKGYQKIILRTRHELDLIFFKKRLYKSDG